MAKTNSQQERRTYVKALDQHGRLWGVTAETGGGQLLPVGPYEPIGWAAPWYPPHPYLALTFEGYQPAVRIDYATLIADRKFALREYQKRARQVGQKLHGQAYRADQPPTQQMIEQIGEPPHAWQLAQAAERGDRWTLGLTDKINEKVAKFLPSPDREDDDGLADDELDLGDEQLERLTAPRPRRQPANTGA